ncbi:RidA family protein [Amycolatopsis sp. H20-H5]|uniref:RidA family protein n=1 Tax=Amycolatopsis sp. H20-H5 TaxID=3046309 RepID=UPI002DB640F5|nr:RidA family protein [Amycolatopsis sp. H20-H5]MEC3980783.1 RidA family protein [Amycolatopsis sp. H20-H5]
MIIQRQNPPALHPTPGYHHVTIVDPGRTVYLAGQCPVDAGGAVVGGDDFLAQADQVVANTAAALAFARAGPADVVRTVVYVSSADQKVLSAVWHHLRDSAIGEAFTTASTLLGVAQLGFPGQLLELDVTAAL